MTSPELSHRGPSKAAQEHFAEHPPVILGDTVVPFNTLVSIEISHSADKKSLEHGYALIKNTDKLGCVLVAKTFDKETADIRTVSVENIIKNNPRLFGA
ncbi:MAG: hypothetical protein JWM56_888 [Candidatus Peribacteria bacterium]|nr:hypothetical protein [Candidatus Peribacteria bacterium]